MFGPTGDMLSKYHKMYLANTYVPGQMMIKESEIFSPGDTLTVVNTSKYIIGRDLSITEHINVYQLSRSHHRGSSIYLSLL